MLAKVIEVLSPVFVKSSNCKYLTKGRSPGYCIVLYSAQRYVPLRCILQDQSQRIVTVQVDIKKLFPKWRNTDKNIQRFIQIVFPKLQKYFQDKLIEFCSVQNIISQELDNIGQKHIKEKETIFELSDLYYSNVRSII